MKQVILSLSLILSICFAVSCGQSKGSGSDTDTTALKLALLPTVESLPFYYAQQTGIYDSLGLDLNLVTFEAAMDADTAFLNGDVNGIVTDVVKANIWRSNGDSVRIVMGGDLTLFLVTSRLARLTKTQSIKEKIVAITRHSSLDFIADKILEKAKMQSEELNKPQINNLTLRTTMLENNQYDGAILPDPFASHCIANGHRNIDGTDKVNLKGLLAVVFPDSIITQRSADISILIKGYDLAVERINRLQTASLQYLPDSVSVDIVDTLYQFRPLSHSYMPADSVVNLTTVWAKGRGLIKNACSYKDLIDSTFVSTKTIK